MNYNKEAKSLTFRRVQKSAKDSLFLEGLRVVDGSAHPIARHCTARGNLLLESIEPALRLRSLSVGGFEFRVSGSGFRV